MHASKVYRQDDAHDRMHMFYEMHRVRIVTCFHAVDSWEPGCRDHPTILHDALTTCFLLHRYFHELPEPICCRGIIFGFVAVAPFPLSLPWHHFRFTAVAPFFLPPWRQMLRIMLLSTFS